MRGKPCPTSGGGGVNPRHQAAIEAASGKASPDVATLRNWYERYAKTQKLRLAYDLQLIERFTSRDDAILEFGSCPPILTIALTQLGYSVCGLDLSPARFETVSSQERLTVMKVNFETAPLPFADNTIDVAIFNEVLEHLRINPIFTFREINRVLRQHGTLLLSTPNLISLKGWWHLAINGFPANDLHGAFSKLETVGHVGHVRLYTPLEVAAFLEKMGFAIHLIVHRGDGWRHESRPIEALRNALPKVFPRLRTHFSIVARKMANLPR